MLARLWVWTLRTCALLVVVLCSSCIGPPRAGTGSHAAPGKPLGSNGCGPPLAYRVFENEAFGADWSKSDNVIAFNAKANDGRYHIYTVKPDGTNRR